MLHGTLVAALAASAAAAQCDNFMAFPWPTRIQVVQSGCTISIIRRPTAMPTGYEHWLLKGSTLYSTQSAALTAELADDATQLEFYFNGQPSADVDPIHIVGACSAAAVSSSGKLCTSWHRHDCMERTGQNPNDCSCYCDALPRIVEPKPDCPDGSEGLVYESATYRLAVVKPCAEWTLGDCGLRVKGTAGCPCVCGEDPTPPALLEEVMHWGFLTGAGLNAVVGVLALTVIINDATPHLGPRD